MHCLPCVRPRWQCRDQGSLACHHSRAVQLAGTSLRLHMTGNGLHPMRAAALRPALRPACSAVSRAGKILPPRRMAADFSELDDDALLELWWAAAEQGDTQRLKDIAGAEPNIINLVRMHSGAATAHAHAHGRARTHAHTTRTRTRTRTRTHTRNPAGANRRDVFAVGAVKQRQRRQKGRFRKPRRVSPAHRLHVWTGRYGVLLSCCYPT